MKRTAALMLAFIMLVMTGCSGTGKNIRFGAAEAARAHPPAFHGSDGENEGRRVLRSA